ncbi:MAG: hypothetical protein KA419_14925 [Acidobacteria bacterium]|nr:hypothetical protein [Acidobacteriota bacterium]
MNATPTEPCRWLTRFAPVAGFAVSLACLVTFAAGFVLKQAYPRTGPYAPPAQTFQVGLAAGVALVGAIVTGFAAIRRSRKATRIGGVLLALLALVLLALWLVKGLGGDGLGPTPDLLAPLLAGSAAVMGLFAGRRPPSPVPSGR